MEGGKNYRRALGSLGEDIACEFLRGKGHVVMERNWRWGHLEIDIISFAADGIHFVEVKTRHISGWQSTFDSINEQKRRTMRRGAMLYRQIHHLRHIIQFDLISVVVDDHGNSSIELTENIL